jgi:nucleotide-binding universal stress UspA family protein
VHTGYPPRDQGPDTPGHCALTGPTVTANAWSMNETLSKPVLVGVDGSAYSRAAVAYGAWEARRRKRPLRLVHGLPPWLQFGVAPSTPYVIDELIASSRALVGEAAAWIRRSDPTLPISTAVIAGSPAGVLIAEAANAALVVVGSRGLGGIAGVLAGSVGSQVATHSPVPVVVLRPGVGSDGHGAAGQHDPTVGPVVVGVDGSAGSRAALEFGFEEAAVRGESLTAVYAWGILPSGNLGPIGPDHYDPVQAQDEADRMLGEALAGWAEKYPEVPVRRRAVRGFDPVAAILDEATGASLVVVGPRGHGALVSLLLGSVADGLLRHARQPVAIAHPA